jgi:hypothetical protein
MSAINIFVLLVEDITAPSQRTKHQNHSRRIGEVGQGMTVPQQFGLPKNKYCESWKFRDLEV